MRNRGYLLGAIAAASYGMNPLFALPLYSAGMSTLAVLFFRYLLAVPIMAAIILMRGQSLRVARSEVKPLMLLGVTAGISSYALFESYNWVDASIASTLIFVYPIMVAVIMAIVYKERLPIFTYICIGIALLGVTLLCKTVSGAMVSAIGVAVVMLSALSYAVYIVYVNHHSLKHLSPQNVTFYVLGIGAALYGLILLLQWGATAQCPVTLPHSWVIINLLGLAVFPTAVSLLCTARAVQHIGATPTAILGVLEPLTAVFFGIIVFHEQLSSRQALGLVLIIVAVTAIIARRR